MLESNPFAGPWGGVHCLFGFILLLRLEPKNGLGWSQHNTLQVSWATPPFAVTRTVRPCCWQAAAQFPQTGLIYSSS